MEGKNTPAPSPAPSQENLFINLGFNLILPILILSKGTEWLSIPPKPNVIVALAFPIAYGIYDLVVRKKWNVFSLLGIVSVFIKGSIVLFELPTFWVAINEAALPGVFAIAVLYSSFTRRPLIRFMLLRPEVFNVDLIESAIVERGKQSEFDRLARKSTRLLSASLFLSAILNYIVARIFVKTEASVDTVAVSKELAAMQGWSFLIIMLPTTAVTAWALYMVVSGLNRITGLTLEQLVNAQETKGEPAKSVDDDHTPDTGKT